MGKNHRDATQHDGVLAANQHISNGGAQRFHPAQTERNNKGTRKKEKKKKRKEKKRKENKRKERKGKEKERKKERKKERRKEGR